MPGAFLSRGLLAYYAARMLYECPHCHGNMNQKFVVIGIVYVVASKRLANVQRFEKNTDLPERAEED